MKKLLWFILLLQLLAGMSHAVDFRPSMLKIESENYIYYSFSHDELDIPVSISGTSCLLVFSIFTNGRSNEISAVQNGFLGWHYVNQVDTCVYYSEPYEFDPGHHSVHWDGRDQDGNYLNVQDDFSAYKYYLWGYDNKSERQPALKHAYVHGGLFDQRTHIQEIDNYGLPRAHPILCQTTERWILGSDPEDESAKLTTQLALPDGWVEHWDPYPQHDDNDNVIIAVTNREEKLGSLMKYRFVNGGDAEIFTDWGENAPFATQYQTDGNSKPSGVAGDGVYLYTTDSNFTDADRADSDFYIYDSNGVMLDEIDLSPWWSSEKDYQDGGQMNGGPSNLFYRHDYIFLIGHGSCLVQMIDPLRYCNTGCDSDLLIWSNGNGDYVCDMSFEITAERPWACNDYNAGLKKSISCDNLLFSLVCVDYGNHDSLFSLFAPDGCGIGTFAINRGEDKYGHETGFQIIDSSTPFDGLYTGTYISGNIHMDPVPHLYGLHYIAQDSFSGQIGVSQDCWDTNGMVKQTFPVGGETFTAGETCTIHWDYVTGCRVPLSISPEFSLDNGVTWNRIANDIETSAGKCSWRVPFVETDALLVRLGSNAFIENQSTASSIRNTIVAASDPTPHTFSLAQNSPNPFNPVTTITYSLARESHTTITVYSVTGEKVATLADGLMSAGKHSAVFNGSNLASGIYFYRLEAGGMVKSGKMMLMK